MSSNDTIAAVSSAPGAAKRREILFKIHSDLPREGPADSASTHRAYRCVGDLASTGRLLDVGCGPGAQTIDLANVCAASIMALDNHRPYLDRLNARVRVAGLSRRVRSVQASMFDMPFANESFNVIWAEGAIYILGFEQALTAWRPLLRPGGYVAATHLSWLASDVPSEAREFWNRSYPAIRDVDTNLAICRQRGFEPIERFVLPESAWWDDYYGPMAARLAALRGEYQGDNDALAVIESSQEEIDIYRRFSRSYGYVFYILRMDDREVLP